MLKFFLKKEINFFKHFIPGKLPLYSFKNRYFEADKPNNRKRAQQQIP